MAVKFFHSFSQTEFEEMHRQLAKVKTGTETVKVSPTALRHLLADYSGLIARLRIEEAGE